MQLLLDTHTLLWWLAGKSSLSHEAHVAIADEANQVFVSAASAWEIATKHRIGKLPLVSAVVLDLTKTIQDQGFAELPITMSHGHTAGNLPGPHRDPFDRMLVAQAMMENLALISNERIFDNYGVRRLW